MVNPTGGNGDENVEKQEKWRQQELVYCDVWREPVVTLKEAPSHKGHNSEKGSK